MAIKKKVKSKAVKEEKKEAPREKYFFAVGRRKTAVAKIKLTPLEKAKEGDITVNGRKINDYFPTVTLQNTFVAPLKAIGVSGKFQISVSVRGGGFRAQAEAARLGIARALVEFSGDFKKPLGDLGYLTRDARVVERKKAGLKKARKAPQWAKR